jgi:ubiquinone/menaquinone biosynthesis C-methylase UbiE
LPPSAYVLGSTEAEHARLLRQAARLAPFTERLFLDAGIGPGQRVLDIGSGVGDVALLAVRLVGPTGEVVGVDRDAVALAKARTRAAEAGVQNISFLEGDISQLTAGAPFDAVVGRLVLQFQPDHVAVLRTLAALLRPGGLIVFQEPAWAPFFTQVQHLPLRASCAKLIIETFRRSGVRPDMDRVLFRELQEIGLPALGLRLDTPIGNDSETRRWLYDLFGSLYPRMTQFGMSLDPLGDLATLSDRLEAELDAASSYAACISLVGAWSRKPTV